MPLTIIARLKLPRHRSLSRLGNLDRPGSARLNTLARTVAGFIPGAGRIGFTPIGAGLITARSGQGSRQMGWLNWTRGQQPMTTSLKDLTPDKRNVNKGTAKGQKLIVSSIQQNGFGRSGLLDKAGNIIAGNKTTEAAAEVFGVEIEPIVVETDGTRPVYVKRTDLDLNDPDPNNPARRLAYLDNLSQHFSFNLDIDALQADLEAGFDLSGIDLSLPDLSGLLNRAEDNIPDVDFKEYDESVENEVEYLECPSCGHKWPK